jgi:hypothetical protein
MVVASGLRCYHAFSLLRLGCFLQIGSFSVFLSPDSEHPKKTLAKPTHPPPTGPRNIEPSTAATKSQIGARSNPELEREIPSKRGTDCVRGREDPNGSELGLDVVFCVAPVVFVVLLQRK